jgi:hypothetical protein
MCWEYRLKLYRKGRKDREGKKAEEPLAYHIETKSGELMKKYLLLLILVLVASGTAVAQALPTVSTFSIVAIDPQTGEMGVAVASR